MITGAQAERTVRAVRDAASVATCEGELLSSVAGIVRSQVPYAAAAWLVTDPTTGLSTDGVVLHLDEEICAPWFTNEFVADDVHKFHDLVGQGAGVLSRTDDRRNSSRWSEIMRPQGLDDEVRLTLDDRAGCWGIVELHRPAGEADFTVEEIQLLELVAPETTRALRRLAARGAVWCNEGPEGPGLLMVQPDDTVEPVTPAGAAWLELLLPDDTGPRSPTAIRTMAQVVRSAAAGGRHGADTRLRLRAANDRWVTLYAEPTLVGDGVAVVVEPSRSLDVALVLARAYGLTEREQEVMLAVARGDSTGEIANRLLVSIHTVRDHVKSALAKVGVGSRSELVATLFDRHYATELFQRIRVE